MPFQSVTLAFPGYADIDMIWSGALEFKKASSGNIHYVL